MREKEGPTSCFFHASTTRGESGEVLTGGGRCFTAVGLGASWEIARERAYSRAAEVRFEGVWYRPDIGDRMYPPRG